MLQCAVYVVVLTGSTLSRLYRYASTLEHVQKFAGKIVGIITKPYECHMNVHSPFPPVSWFVSVRIRNVLLSDVYMYFHRNILARIKKRGEEERRL